MTMSGAGAQWPRPRAPFRTRREGQKEYNEPLAGSELEFVAPPGTRELETYDVLLMWVQDVLLESGAKATDLMDTWQGQLGDYLGGSWVPR